MVAPPDADKFVFTDYLHGWAATYACDYLENGDSMNVQPRTCPSTVFSTDNAGRTWVPNLHLEDSVIAIGILDSSPVIVEQEVPPTIEGTDSLLIVRGDPTGSTWTELSRVPVSVGTINLLVSLEFESDGSGWIDVFTTGAGCGGGGCQEQIDVTRDAGRVWTALDGLDQNPAVVTGPMCWRSQWLDPRRFSYIHPGRAHRGKRWMQQSHRIGNGLLRRRTHLDTHDLFGVRHTVGAVVSELNGRMDSGRWSHRVRC